MCARRDLSEIGRVPPSRRRSPKPVLETEWTRVFYDALFDRLFAARTTVTTELIHCLVADFFSSSLPKGANANFCYMPFRELALPFEERSFNKPPEDRCVARFLMHEKNDFVEGFKILLDTNQKIISLDH